MVDFYIAVYRITLVLSALVFIKRLLKHGTSMASLSQLDARYDQVEDRVLLRLTNSDQQEYRLWFTRRMTISMLTDFKGQTSAYRISTPPNAEKTPAATTPEQTKVQAEFEQAASVAQSNFKDKFVPGKSFPLGESGIVVNRIDFKPNANGPDAHALRFLPKTGEGVTIGVSVKIFNSIFEILERTARNTDWKISDLLATASHSTLQ